MNIRPVGAELFHEDGRTDGQTDRHGKANSRFMQCSEGAQKHWSMTCIHTQRS
jgi:hypothetical protein